MVVPESRPVRAGAVVTAVATVAALLLTGAVPFEVVQRTVHESTGIWLSGSGIWFFLRFLGGPVGGFATGYLTGDRWQTSTTNGVKAVLVGLVIVYVAYSVLLVGYSLVQGSFPPIVYLLFVVPVLIGFPFVAAYLTTGFAGSLVGMWVRQSREGTLLA